MAIFDLESMHAKTGIAHRRLKPTLGLVDPENTKYALLLKCLLFMLCRHLPPAVVAASGFDVLCHSLESYTAIPYGTGQHTHTHKRCILTRVQTLVLCLSVPSFGLPIRVPIQSQITGL